MHFISFQCKNEENGRKQGIQNGKVLKEETVLLFYFVWINFLFYSFFSHRIYICRTYLKLFIFIYHILHARVVILTSIYFVDLKKQKTPHLVEFLIIDNKMTFNELLVFLNEIKIVLSWRSTRTHFVGYQGKL